jgi:hypothetical protein
MCIQVPIYAAQRCGPGHWLIRAPDPDPFMPAVLSVAVLVEPDYPILEEQRGAHAYFGLQTGRKSAATTWRRDIEPRVPRRSYRSIFGVKTGRTLYGVGLKVEPAQLDEGPGSRR